MVEGLERLTVVPKLPGRPKDSHKGMFGRVLVVGGSSGMIGAVAMAANSALRGGAGLVTFAAPQTVQPFMATLCPCATSVPLACDEFGHLTPEAIRQLHDAATQCDVLAAGPGMRVGPGQQLVVQALLQQHLPMVIDADGLNNLANIAGWAALRGCALVLTPHPGEFGRLIRKSTKEIQADRLSLAVSAARQWAADGPSDKPLVLVLKGEGTVVTDGRRAYVNDTGNPGMASGGTGDVLTGLLAALIGQGLAPFEAACLAVHAHGRAGDLAAEKLGQVSLIATDLIDFLPPAMQEAVAK